MFETHNIINQILNNTNEQYNKQILYYNTIIIYFDIFNIIKNKIEKIKILKYKNLIDYKSLILYYNNFIKKYNLYIYGINYDIFTIDLFNKKNINNICLIPEISPFKVSHHVYQNIVNIKSKSYKIKGFICFIVLRKTKRQESIKIYIFNDIKYKKDIYYVYDIKELLNFVSPKLLLEISVLVQRDLLKEILSDEDIYVGYLATISYKNNNKIHFLDIINFYNDHVNCELYLNIYFKIYQHKKNSNNYKFLSIDSNVFNGLNNIIYNLEYNDNYKDPGIIIKDNIIYIVSSSFIKSTFTNNYTINKQLQIETILQYKNIKFNFVTDFKKILYSRENLYILQHTEDIYIPDIYISNKTYEKRDIYIEVNAKYILKKNTIIFKKNILQSLEMLLKIDTNVINWFDFLTSSNTLNKNTNLYEWFIDNYEKYSKINPDEAYQISMSFKCLSLFDIFQLVFDNNDFNNFIIYFKKKYKIENKIITEINDSCDIIKKFDYFIDIIKIFLYLYNL